MPEYIFVYFYIIICNDKGQLVLQLFLPPPPIHNRIDPPLSWVLREILFFLKALEIAESVLEFSQMSLNVDSFLSVWFYLRHDFHTSNIVSKRKNLIKWLKFFSTSEDLLPVGSVSITLSVRSCLPLFFGAFLPSLSFLLISSLQWSPVKFSEITTLN